MIVLAIWTFNLVHPGVFLKESSPKYGSEKGSDGGERNFV